jgi:hypothetical protein
MLQIDAPPIPSKLGGRDAGANVPRRFDIRVAFLISVLFLCGCGTPAKWTYPINLDSLYRSPATRSDLVIGVLPFREARPRKNQVATLFVYLIPLSPFGWLTYERPEYARSFNTVLEYDFQLDEDFGKAVTKSFDTSGLFRRVYFILDGETAEADYILRGTARRAVYEGTVWSYGLSAFGPLLWFIGLPSGTSTNSIDIELELIDRDDEVVWSFRASRDHEITQGLYYNRGNDVLHFSTLMESLMNEALRDLEPRLSDL